MNPIMNYAVAAVATTDAWGGMVRATVVLTPCSEQDFDAACTNWEMDYKAETGFCVMPTAYRTAKSVIKSAIKAGLPLIGADGEPMPKSQLDKAIKEAKDSKTPNEKAAIMARTFVTFCKKHGLRPGSLIANAIEDGFSTTLPF